MERPPIPRLLPSACALLVVDVQERLMPTLPEPDVLAHHCALLLGIARALELPAIVTEQYPRGLGPTVPTVVRAMDRDVGRIEKTRFSAFVPEVASRLEASGRRTVLVCGIEAHICVLQTVLDLRAEGYEAFVVTDAVSAGQPGQIPFAFHRMQQAGAVMTGMLSATYELMADKEHPAFKRCLDFVKSVR